MLVLIGLTAAQAGCGGQDDDGSKDPFTAVRQGQTPAAARKAAPRWEGLARLAGSGARKERLLISRRALQWRIRWRCSSGAIAFAVAPRDRSGLASASGQCPGSGTTNWSQRGPVRLDVTAAGPWRAVVEQQFDSALHEPPLAGMRSTRARVLGRGRFYRMEGKGGGKALLYRLPTGRLALRLQSFRTAPTTGMFVWLSKAPRPTTSKQVIATQPIRLRGLKSTLGDQNYLLPRRLGRDAVRSVVIWYKPTGTAYIAAAL